jgi:riboflavin synthase
MVNLDFSSHIHSISMIGACLTITAMQSEPVCTFAVGLSPETLRRTNLGQLHVGSMVHLERAMRATDRFDGHMVQGHIDGAVKLLRKRDEGDSTWLTLEMPPSLAPYLVQKGYVCLDGVSLTVCEVDDVEHYFTVMLVAYTKSRIMLHQKNEGDMVNVEVDIVGKYLERQMALRFASTSETVAYGGR